jgi:hypothetical protein
MDIGEYSNRTYDILGLDSNGTRNLDTCTVKEFVMDGATKAYSDLGVPKAGKYLVPAGSSGVFISAGLVRIVSVAWEYNYKYKALKRIDPSKISDESYYKDFTDADKAIRPSFYIRHGDSINIVPRHTTADTITVMYFDRGPFPGSRADTVSVVMPVEYRWAVIYAAASFCEIRRRNFGAAREFEKLYQQEVMRLRARFELEGIVEP